MPKVNDTVHIRFSMRGDSAPFWQTNATVASVSGASLLQPRNSSLSGKDGGCLTGRCGAGRMASNAAH